MERKQDIPVLEVSGLSVSFQMYDGALDRKDLQVISDLSMRVHAGEVLAVAGSSGSGKSLLASAILGILPENAVVDGLMRYRGRSCRESSEEPRSRSCRSRLRSWIRRCGWGRRQTAMEERSQKREKRKKIRERRSFSALDFLWKRSVSTRSSSLAAWRGACWSQRQ